LATIPTTAQAATAKIATSVAADAFSRGSESPVTPFVPTVFYRAATEMLCENVAALVVDSTAGKVYSSTDVAGRGRGHDPPPAGYPPSDAPPRRCGQGAAGSLHRGAGANRNTATTALRSTFAGWRASPHFAVVRTLK